MISPRQRTWTIDAAQVMATVAQIFVIVEALLLRVPILAIPSCIAIAVFVLLRRRARSGASPPGVRNDVVFVAVIAQSALLIIGVTNAISAVIDRGAGFYMQLNLAVSMPFIVAPIAFWIAFRVSTHFAIKPGTCSTCTYDRTGLPPNIPCPECGN